MTDTEHPVLCRCPGCKREAPADIDHWRREFDYGKERDDPGRTILTCPECGTPGVKIVPSWWEVELDETEFWTIDEEDRPYIARIVGIYLVNRAERTYACSATPAYWMHCLDQKVRLAGGMDPMLNDEHTAAIQDKYENHANPNDADGYHTCSDIDNLPAIQLYHHADITCDDMDEAVEELAGGGWF